MTQSIIEPAKSSRSKCGGCKKKIEQGELRFGSFSERWESFRWFHLACGAAFDAADFEEAAEDYGLEGVEAILAEAKNAGKGTKTPRVEEATSDRSSCFVCGEKIAPKGTLRGVLFREVEVDQWRKGFAHVKCMSEASDLDRDDLIEQVLDNSLLSDEQQQRVIEEL